MAGAMRVTGAWTGILGDWLDREGLAAPGVRAALAGYAPDDVVPLPEWRALLARAVTLKPGMPAPGLAIGAGVQPRHVGVLGYLVLASNTVGEAMLAYQHYERLFYGVDIAEVGAADGHVEIRWRAEDSIGDLDGDTVGIAALVAFLRRQVDDPPPPALVSFVHPAPATDAARALYEAFFGCPVQFGDTHTRVRFPVSYLAIPMPHSDPGLRELLGRQARALLAAAPDADAFQRALQQVLLRLLPDGNATLPRAARELGAAPRTVQRRLAERGLTFQQFLDRIRTELARSYLGDRALSMTDIALLLGFSEQSAFNRAFRRWTGNTPARLRRQLPL
ncbi:MAG: helix-turn-helix domain-containing protein [Pseudomonadota bacterium]